MLTGGNARLSGRSGVWIILLTALLLAACSSQLSNQEGPESPDSFSEQVAQSVASARDAGASQEQIVLLEQAKEQGFVSFEQAAQAARAAVDCMHDQGLVDAEYWEQTSSGFTVPGWVVGPNGRDSVEAENLSFRCSEVEYDFVSHLFQTQARSVAQREEFENQQLPAVIACLGEAGVNVDPNATKDEVLTALAEASATQGVDVDSCVAILFGLD